MKLSLNKRGNDENTLDDARRFMKKASTLLAQSKWNETRAPQGLMFCLDLTASRQPTLDQARIATTAMFDVIKKIGKLVVKLAYYRGKECKESQWCDDSAVLRQSMLSLSCECGYTQIARLLRLVLNQTEKPSAVVFIGDQCEENPVELWQLAEDLGKKSIPLFVFHECDDEDKRCLKAKPVFERMAQSSGGAYVDFTLESGAALLELLSSVAAFSTAGAQGVKQLAEPKTAEARQLRKSLILGNGSQE